MNESNTSLNIDLSTLPTKKDELRAFMSRYKIDEVECTIPDFHGVARGKAMPAVKFSASTPTFLPFSIFFQSITGEYIDYDSPEYDTETDMLLVPDLSTIRQIPWARYPSLHVIHDIHYVSGEPVPCAPRNQLKHILALYKKEGWQPVVAPELEFYLTKKNINPDMPLEPPVGRSGRQSVGRQSYSMAAIDEYEPIIEDIYQYAEIQGLTIDTIIQEGGAAQLEINMDHGDPLILADSVFLFKRLIREAALKHGCYATFMAKPMTNQPGSAMHIHQSVVDSTTGKNIFNDEQGNATEHFYHFIGGHQKYLEAATCILAPYVNSYRRLVPSGSAPINLEWSFDNRSAGIRVPNSSPEARRVENRIAGVDTNPYNAIAASLATGYLGMMNKIKPRDQFIGEAYNADYGLPRGLQEALVKFDQCDELKNILGEQFSSIYLKLKEHEFNEFMQVVSPWEREHLLLTV
jgi:glutamine synthetase